MKDRLGVTIVPTDRVRVIAYGYGARLVDCGVESPVVKLRRVSVVIIDSDRYERVVSSSCLAVIRRDGINGLEGNKSR